MRSQQANLPELDSVYCYLFIPWLLVLEGIVTVGRCVRL
jgi:hypothetical protein